MSAGYLVALDGLPRYVCPTHERAMERVRELGDGAEIIYAPLGQWITIAR